MTHITLPRATVEQALEALTPWMDSDHTVQHAAYHALRAALAKQRLTDAQQEMERSIESLKAALAQQAEPVASLNAWAADRLARHGIPMPETPRCTDCRGIGYDASGQLCACQQNPSF